MLLHVKGATIRNKNRADEHKDNRRTTVQEKSGIKEFGVKQTEKDDLGVGSVSMGIVGGIPVNVNLNVGNNGKTWKTQQLDCTITGAK